MKVRGWTAVLLVLFAVVAAKAQAPDFSKIEIKAEKVAGDVYMLYGVGGFAGGNIGVSVGPDGTVLVDAQFEPLVPKIEAALKGIAEKPVRFVLNTHYHGDHTHGNKVFGRTATILAHENVRKRMEEDTSFDNQPNTTAPPHALRTSPSKANSVNSFIFILSSPCELEVGLSPDIEIRIFF